MHNIIKSTLAQWLADPHYTNPISTPEIRADRTLNLAIRAQNEIGWHNFFRGFIAKGFQYYYDEHNRDRPMNYYQSNKWMIEMIKVAQQFVELQWSARNEKIHGIDAQTRLEARREKAMREIQQIYNLKPMMEQSVNQLDHLFLQKPIEDFKNKETKNLELWIQNVKPTILRILDLNKLPDDDPNDSANATTAPT